jgi:hypothetical protein
MTEDTINHKQGSDTELQGKYSRGRPRSKWEPQVRKGVIQNDGSRWAQMDSVGCGIACIKWKHLQKKVRR